MKPSDIDRDEWYAYDGEEVMEAMTQHLVMEGYEPRDDTEYIRIRKAVTYGMTLGWQLSTEKSDTRPE